MSDPRTGNVLPFPGPGGVAPAAPGPGGPAAPGPGISAPVPAPAARPPGPPPTPMMGGPGGPPPIGMPHPVPPPGGGIQAPPGMMINPAFVQWSMISKLWHGEQQRRRSQFLAACHLIRHDVCHGYKVDIEADSTVAADEMAEKQARTEFLQSVLPMLQLLIPQAQQNPNSVPLIHALVMFGVRAFPAARSLEQEFEESFQTLLKSPAPSPGPPKGNVKSPEEIASEQQIAQGDQQVDQQKNQVAAAQVQVQQQKNAIEMYKAYMAMSGQKAEQQQDAYFRAAEMAQQAQELEGRENLERARLTHLVTRDAAGMI